MSGVPTLDEALTAWVEHNASAVFEARHGSAERAAMHVSLAASAAQVVQALAQREQADR